MDTGKVEGDSIPAFSGRAFGGQPGLVSHHHDRQGSISSQGDRLVKPVSGLAVDVTPPGVLDPFPETVPESIEDRAGRFHRTFQRHLSGERNPEHVFARLHVDQSLDVGGVGVVAEQVP